MSNGDSRVSGYQLENTRLNNTFDLSIKAEVKINSAEISSYYRRVKIDKEIKHKIERLQGLLLELYHNSNHFIF